MAKSSGSQTVERALRLLKLFNDNRSSLTIKEAIAATGLNRTTIFRLLTALVNEGFLERAANGDYRLGPELTALGGYAVRQNNLVMAARPILNALVADVDERVTIEVLSRSATGDAAMLVIDEIAGSHRLGIREFAGTHLPIHATSTGKVLLAHLSAEKQQALLLQPLTQLTNQTFVDLGLFSAELDSIHTKGYAIANEELEDGLIAMATPIFDSHGEAIAAISLVGPTVRISAERTTHFITKLLAASQAISRRIGFRPN